MVLLILGALTGCVQFWGDVPDYDGDGYTVEDGDCNDADASLNPGAREEWYDGTDQDCDGNDADKDLDGYVSVEQGGEDCWDDPDNIPGDYRAITGQGFDQPAPEEVHPGAEETWYDGVDSDCGGDNDWDADGDNHNSDTYPNRAGQIGGDCDDMNPEIYQGAPETWYDGVDSDCLDDNAWDDYDQDGDGYPAGYVEGGVPDFEGIAGDCDDTDPEAFPNDSEDTPYDCIDANCDGVDADGDGDGWLWIGESYKTACPNWNDPASFFGHPEEVQEEDQDCWDANWEILSEVPPDYEALDPGDQLQGSEVYPGAPDVFYDGIDADCAGDNDFDADLDGYDISSLPGSSLPWTGDDPDDLLNDCDDEDSNIHPGQFEDCSTQGVDDDCSGSDNDPDEENCNGTDYYRDLDGDGDGQSGAMCLCEVVVSTGYTALTGDDCNDSDGTVYGGATELCDGQDNDCDGSLPTDESDDDLDGHVECTQDAGGWDGSAAVTGFEDCDDGEFTVYLGAPEICDGQDNDCDSLIPAVEGDDDGDGYVECDVDAAGWAGGAISGGQDCDDADAAIHPGAQEVCDSADTDEDCDGLADDDDTDTTGQTSWYWDNDADGFGDANSLAGTTCDPVSGAVSDDSDCDDTASTTYPGADEYCDGVDTDCDGTADESDALDATLWYLDSDTDGYGDSTQSLIQCDQPSGYVSDDEDCDDADSSVNPGATEVCDSADVDEDCDGLADDADTEATGKSTGYTDQDGDGYGDPSTGTDYCDPPSTVVSDNTDCDDSLPDVHPGGTEVCDSADTDEDCNGLADDDDPAATGQTTWFNDSDADTYGDPATYLDRCNAPSGFVADNSDCDDSDNTVYPGASELCDGQDNDCSGTIAAEEDDDDLDGYVECTVDSGGWDGSAISGGDDCDDDESDINPGQTEICDADDTDEDCDGLIDDDDDSPSGTTSWYSDDDADGYGDASDFLGMFCDASGGSEDDTDCDDTDATVYPGASELCDGQDNDCLNGIPGVEGDDDGDGYVECVLDAGGWDGPGSILDGEDCDDADASVAGPQDWYADEDGDGYGDSEQEQTDCDQPTGYVSDDTDCDDTDPSINPGATESSNEADDDCDDAVDEGFRSAGDLLVSEMMAGPMGSVPDEEWFEIYNPGTTDLYLDGATFESNCDLGGEFVLGVGGLVLPAGGYAVLCYSDTSLGTLCDYVYGVDQNGSSQQGESYDTEFCLDPADGGILAVKLVGTSLDAVAYENGSSGWPIYEKGVSHALDPSLLTATLNNLGANWCYPGSSEVYDSSQGNIGTPGSVAGSCNATIPNGN